MTFEQLEVGRIFWKDDLMYIKTNPICSFDSINYNAVVVASDKGNCGKYVYFSDDTQIDWEE